MSFLSKIFGKAEVKVEMPDAFAYIHRVLTDEALQLELAPTPIRTILEASPAYDQNPDVTGLFGLTETNPIPVHGPIGEIAYLSKLKTSAGERILFHRLGAISTVDVFECVTFSGSEWHILFLDFYHPRPSRLAPDGFLISHEVAQFSGFHRRCNDFPYDFAEGKAAGKASGLSLAYIAMSQIQAQFQNEAFTRPAKYIAQLASVQSRLSSTQT